MERAPAKLILEQIDIHLWMLLEDSFMVIPICKYIINRTVVNQYKSQTGEREGRPIKN
jgi:hypothetical protein